MSRISVIVPVYKVEKFVGRCITSLMEQTLQDVEFIIVDDASPDGSMAVVRDVVSRYPDRDIRILTHEGNRGLPAARNTGLAVATGEYIYHCDSDDWTEPDLLEKMYAAVSADGSDFVYCDFWLSFEKNERYMPNPDYQTSEEVLKKGFLGGVMKYNVWNKLISRRLYDGIVFPEGHSMGEDMTVIQLVAGASKVSHVKEALYHYAKTNAEAYSNTFSQRHLDDIKFNVDRTEKFLLERFGAGISTDIGIFKLGIKLPFLISDSKEDHLRWQEWYPESNAYAMVNRELPFRTRVLQWMASKGQWWYVCVYYRLVYRFVYGVLFK